MKSQDIVLLVLIVVFAAVGAFFLSGKLIGSSDKKYQAETVTAITTEFVLPTNKVFNAGAVNPTQLIEIAPVENPDPFADSL